MLSFALYHRDYDVRATVHIDPAAVVSIVETSDRRAYSGSQEIAVIHLATGEKHTVCDEGRRVSRSIETARQQSLPIEREQS